jgi:YbgC/YbaW family acyl-CoA thioester hydrolase
MPPHRTTVRVRFGELDPYNHVNHAVYIAYLEAGRTDAMHDVGIPIHRLAELGWNVVVTDLQVKFRVPAVAGDTLVVETWIAQLGAITGRWAQRIMRGDTVLIESEVRAGAVDMSGRPKRMTPEVMELFRPLVVESPAAS